MRFIEHGPDIPDELLLALDEGKVMFFCGAGVSLAGAELPDFLGLAKKVLADLRVLPTEPAHQILNIAKPNKEPMPTPVSADLIFGELEKDFYPQDIQASVAKHLITENGMKPTAHSDLVKLATTHDGHTRLVTTNFDRLFENCAPDVTTWQYPNLPDLTKDTEFEGLVYLHGRVNKQYTGCDEEFILSTAEFGRAYLAEGSATRFFKQIIAEYTVVFVGYGADDPPVRYLLEAFNKEKPTPKDKNKIYAFQSGTSEEANKKWANRGVTVIPYDEADKHKALWNTFSEWVVRAKTTEAWQDDIMKIAVQGPEGLLPFDREKVLQMVATEAGAKRFGADNNPPPATWLNVFNFESNYRDKCEAGQENMVSLIGTQTPSAGKLPHRFYTLGNWIASVSDQPAAVWWAVRKTGIHSRVQDKIKEALGRKTDCPPYIKLAWQYIFDTWKLDPDDINHHQHNWFLFKQDLDSIGWGATMVRRYEELTKPRMLARKVFMETETIPQKDAKTDFGQLVDLKIWYNDDVRQIEIPPKYLAEIASVWKRNLDKAIHLEKERIYHLYPAARSQTKISYYLAEVPIIASTDPSVSDVQRTSGLAGAVLYYAALFETLLKRNPQQAQIEFQTWDKEDNNVYVRLRIWSARFVKIIADKDLRSFFATISRKTFWGSGYQRDLLHTIKKRWSGMSEGTQLVIEKRILQGYEKYASENKNEYIKYRDQRIFERLDWLKNKKCVLSVATKKKLLQLKKANPEYNDKHRKNADRSMEIRGGMVVSKTDPSVLLGLPLSRILDKAQEERDNRKKFLVEYDPFDGLCKDLPIRAFAALHYEAKQGKFRAWAWHKFLGHEKRKNDPVRLRQFIAEALVCIPDETIVELIQTLAWWLLNEAEKLIPSCVPIFEKLIKHLIKVMDKNHANKDAFITIRNGEPLSFNGVLNSNVGIITEALLGNPSIKNLKVGQSLPPSWKTLVEGMLNLPDDLGRHALVMFTFRLGRFYAINPQWTHDNLLQPLFEGNPDTADAWWAGYLWGAGYSSNLKLFKKIKPYLLARASNKDSQKKDDTPAIAQFILSNWGAEGEQRISDEEFHKILLDTDDDFRARILWKIKSFCEDDPHPPHWKEKRRQLFENVWPLHIRAKTPHTISKLISFAFVDDPAFPQMSKTILRLLGQEISQGSIHSFLYGTDNKNTVDKHPKIALEILHKIVPEYDFLISYRVTSMLDRIATADPNLTRDPRFKELQRRWAAR